MRFHHVFFIPGTAILLLSSCNVLEKASGHGFTSGYYQLDSKNDQSRKVYADVTEQKIDVYQLAGNQPAKETWLSVSLVPGDSIAQQRLVFRKQGLDIDITSVLLKYRPALQGLRPQLTTDFNMALYAGWRFDNYYVTGKTDPLGRSYHKISSRGWDLGFFAGPGTTTINAYTTRNVVTDEYSAMIIQAGLAGFIESNVASFGFGLGVDHLVGADRTIWIYRGKPWMGFIVGIALN